MIDFRNHGLLLGVVILVALVSPAAAFGAGNIASLSKVEGQNWRHGDIEDALLTLAMARAMKHKKFNKIMVSRVYFGNWLRDYSQAIDVGTVKSVSAEAIRLLLCVLGFLTFGYGSGEFEITAERLGCYRPEDHIDNPKNYADNKDARQYDRRLRGPVDEQVELAVDPRTGMKNYIANEQARIMTSAQHVRNLFGRCIELGRRYKNSENKEDLYESLRLMGTGLHCLEDFLAHSNYCELALIEMGERDIFPHCGRDTRMRLEGSRDGVYPIVTGTFGGVDFLHSVVGEVSDKLTQNEIDELAGTLQDSKNADTSLLRDLLDKLPSGLFGGSDDNKAKIDELQNNASAAQVENMSVSPRNPEEFTRYVGQVFNQVMPAIKFHDDIMQSITSAVEKIPVLPKVIEQLEDQLSQFVFSIMAPFVVPLIHQIRNELRTGSEEVVQSSEQEQHVVFNDDRSTDPTHSMLSKDHFSNVGWLKSSIGRKLTRQILNEIAGRIAARMLHWVVPQLMNAIDDDSTDVNRLLNRIIYGVMHHPAQKDIGQDGVSEARNIMFDQMREWWGELGNEQDEYRRKLSREGVQRGENHKEGVEDTGHGHGCAGKLKMQKLYGEPQTMETKIAGAAANAIFDGASGIVSGFVKENTGLDLSGNNGSSQSQNNNSAEDKGGLGGFLSAAGSILGDAFGTSEEKQSSSRQSGDGSYSLTESEYGRQGSQYGQSQHSQSHYGGSGSGRHTSSSGYEGRTERQEYSSSSHHRRQDDDDSYGGGYSGRIESSGYGRQESYGRSSNNEGRGGSSYSSSGYGRQQAEYGGSSGYGRQESSYGSNNGYGRQESGYGGNSGHRQESSYGGDSGYGRQESGYSGNSGNGRNNNSYGDGGYDRQDSGYDGNNEYERRDEGRYERREQPGGYAEKYSQSGHSQEYEREGRDEYGGGNDYDRRNNEYERREGRYGGGY